MEFVNKPLMLRIIFAFLLMPFFMNAQADVNQATDNSDEVVKYPQFEFKGLFQARFLASLSKDVDVLGVHSSTGEVTQNSFDVKRVRVGLNTKLSQNFEVVILVNLADFKYDTKGKVLENAYAKSAIIDALSTMVVNETQIKILAWYDNEWGYSNRMVELARKVALSMN